MIIFHCSVALLGILFASVALKSPSKLLIRMAAIFALLTLGSGVGLVVLETASLLRTCSVGVLYLLIVGAMIGAAQLRFVRAQTIKR